MRVWFSFVSLTVFGWCACAQSPEPAAVVVRPPATFSALAGQTVRLTCVAYGYPVPNIIWTTNASSPIDLADKVSQETVTANGTTFAVSFLQLCDITLETASQYTCTASNGVSGTGIASDSANTVLSVSLPLTEPPAIVVRPPEVNTVDADNTVEMICVAYGNPVPTVIWSRPGCSDLNDTGNTTNIKIYSEMISYGNTTFQKSVMQICGMQQEDSNRYTCTAKNGVSGTGLATSSASFQVDVRGGEREVSSSSPSPTEGVETAEELVLVDGFMATIIILAEGVVILILLFILLIITVVACKMKKTQAKQLSLLASANKDVYALPLRKQDLLDNPEEDHYAHVDEVLKTSPMSTNPSYASTAFHNPTLEMSGTLYVTEPPIEGDVTYEPMEGNGK